MENVATPGLDKVIDHILGMRWECRASITEPGLTEIALAGKPDLVLFDTDNEDNAKNLVDVHNVAIEEAAKFTGFMIRKLMESFSKAIGSIGPAGLIAILSLVDDLEREEADVK